VKKRRNREVVIQDCPPTRAECGTRIHLQTITNYNLNYSTLKEKEERRRRKKKKKTRPSRPHG
jgi:hypothetical protein